MKCTIIKEFSYAHDGNSTEALKPGGEDREIRDNLVPGLVAAGLIKPPTAQKAVPGIEPSPAKVVAPENKIITAAPENKDTTNTTPQRDRRKK